MTRLLVLVEGQSEETFVKRTLTPHLAQHGVYIVSDRKYPFLQTTGDLSPMRRA